MTLLPEPKKDYGRLKNYINGEWVESAATETRTVVNPATGEPIARVPMSTRAEVEKAVQAAKNAFAEWREVPPVRRARYFFKLKELLEEHREEISRMLVQEMGKTIGEARGELQRSIEEVEVANGIPSLMQGYNSEDVSPGIDSMAIRQPIGVFFCIPPSNFPALVPFEYMPYAVASGNTYVIKPSSDVPLSQNKCFELIDEAGFPPGVINMVNGGRDVVNALLESPDTKGISFVGSTPVARDLYVKAAQYNKRAQCAGGAKNFVVVMPDANLDMTVGSLITSFFGASGQRCLAGAVLLPVGDIYEELRNRFVAAASKLKLGYGLDEETQMGPLYSKKHLENVLKYIDKGLEEGAKLILDGRNPKVEGYPNGSFLGPTIFDEVQPNMVIANEEIFGPVASIIPTKDFEQALKIIDANRFGHSAMIFTSSGKWAREFQYRVQVGNVGINIGIAAPMAFFTLGGFQGRESFFGDLHGRKESLWFFTERKIVTSRWP
jgi:malonate-semialdehyde dehydrogenase (acetylating)/methylmalonate-semialdehyde dehydrogenase